MRMKPEYVEKQKEYEAKKARPRDGRGWSSGLARTRALQPAVPRRRGSSSSPEVSLAPESSRRCQSLTSQNQAYTLTAHPPHPILTPRTSLVPPGRACAWPHLLGGRARVRRG